MVRLLNPDRRRVRNYTSLREQWRLMLLILPLGLVILFMARLRDPKTAERINQFFSPPVMAQSEVSGSTVADSAQRTSAPATKSSATPIALFPGIKPELLKTIRDNTYFRNSEKYAWFHFFALLQRTPEADIEKMHALEAGYVQLVDQPDFYRGKLVKVYGYTRQITKQTPAPNDLGIKSYYRIIVDPTDDIDWPIFVYALKLPPNLKVGDNLMSNMVVTGLFFKKLSYPSQDGMGTGPVILARTIEDFGSGAGMRGFTEIRPPAPIDQWAEEKPEEAAAKQEVDQQVDDAASFRDVLTIAGWNVDRLAAFDDGVAFSDEQRKKAIELLRRLRAFDSASLADWAHDGLHYVEVLRQPDEYRGQLVHLDGRVTKVTPHKLPPEEAQRLEMPEYYECEFMLDNERPPSKLLTTRVPKAWLQSNSLAADGAVASATALYVKRLGNDDTSPAIWLTKEIAWHPTKSLDPDAELFGPDIVDRFAKTGDPQFGVNVLGKLGVDVGLFDDVQTRGRIRAEERELFYQIMNACGKFAPSVYVDIARSTLPAVRKDWEKKVAEEEDPKRRALANVAANRAAAGRYSVAPLFNEPESQLGHLIVVDGSARRAVRVEVGEKADGTPSDVSRRFGIDHYYEMEVFTDDSQNYPLVFCVRKLPENFPTGEGIDVPVRVAGFFFKDWLYRTRHAGGDEDTPDADTGPRGQYAPLLIGAEPTMLATLQTGKNGAGQLVGGALFVLALAAIWGITVWFARGDRRFREKTLAANYSLPPGESLNDLKLPEE